MSARVYVVEAGYDYEGGDTKSVHATLKGARRSAKDLGAPKLDRVDTNTWSVRWPAGSFYDYVAITRWEVQP